MIGRTKEAFFVMIELPTDECTPRLALVSRPRLARVMGIFSRLFFDPRTQLPTATLFKFIWDGGKVP